MLSAIGQMLPAAVGIAISPIIVLLTVLLLTSGRSRATAAALVAGAMIGIFMSVTVAYIVTTGVEAATGEEEVENGVSILQLALGLLFAVLAVRTWRHRPRPGDPPQESKLLKQIGTLRWWQAAGLGFALVTVVAPKNLTLGIGAGAALAEQGLGIGVSLAVEFVFVLVAVSTSALPLGVAFVLGDRAAVQLDAFGEWLSANSNTIMLVLFVLLTATFIGKGLGIAG